jgi:hypothetical protein
MFSVQGSRNEPAKPWTADPGAWEDLEPYFLELLADMTEAAIDVVADDLDVFEQTGQVTLNLFRLLRRAQCLSDADRITLKFAA